jgi:hypothetical protein
VAADHDLSSLAGNSCPASLLCQMPSSLTFVTMLDMMLSDMFYFIFPTRRSFTYLTIGGGADITVALWILHPKQKAIVVPSGEDKFT